MNREKLKMYAVPIVCFVIAAVLVSLFVYNQQSKNKSITLQYQPVGACQAFTSDDAKKILGNDIIKQGEDKAILSGETSTSKCGYTDKSLDQMAAIAIAIQTGVSDKGVQQNKSDFAANKKANDTEDVPGLGSEAAFYNKTNGVLNLRDGIVWIMVNYTVDGKLTGDSQAKAVEVARIMVGDATTK